MRVVTNARHQACNARGLRIRLIVVGEIAVACIGQRTLITRGPSGLAPHLPPCIRSFGIMS